MKFSDLQLEPRLQSAIEKLGYQDCTPIQEAVIPLVQAGKDVSGLAQTGTGKTAAFLVPLMDRILKGQFVDWRASQFILILVPTRELAEQVYENVVKLSEVSGLRGISVYGGTGYEKQKEGLRNQVEFVVATPGRLIDLYKENFLDLKQVRAIVFDEADRMFDMGFKDDMKFILQRVPKERQFLVFSATLNFDVLNTAYQFGAEPVEVNVSKDQARAENVRDAIFHVGQEEKPMYLASLIKKHNPKQTIIFSNFKNNVERVANYLSQNGMPAMAISSLLTQVQRNRVLELFKADNEKNILVATDVAARGLDIKGVDMVINFELPMDAESYVHRIGRTGRAGTEGLAFSLVSDRDVDSLARIEEYLKHKLEAGWMEDAELIRDLKPMPREDRGRNFDRPREGGRPSSDRRPREGGGPRSDRRPDRGPRHENRPRPQGAEAGPGQQNAGQAGHRGPRGERPRHQAQNGQSREGQPRRENNSSRHNDRRPDLRKPRSERMMPENGQRPQQQARKPNHGKSHPGARQHAGAAKPGAMKKISGFFKKIFGA